MMIFFQFHFISSHIDHLFLQCIADEFVDRANICTVSVNSDRGGGGGRGRDRPAKRKGGRGRGDDDSPRRQRVNLRIGTGKKGRQAQRSQKRGSLRRRDRTAEKEAKEEAAIERRTVSLPE